MNCKAWSSLVVLFALLLGSSTGWGMPAGSVLYAKSSDSGAGNCSSWADACTLQAALGRATAGDEIWVAQGTHKPTIGTDRSATFRLKSGVAVYGGFAGTETSREQRDWVAHETILSGDIGTPVDPDDNSYSVVNGGGTDGSAVLDGFTITGGNASGGSGYGGGMRNWDGSPTLANVTFSGNSAKNGGGMHNGSPGSPTLTNVTFSGNSSTTLGGGMNNDGGSPTLTNVIFSGNSSQSGGGMFDEGGRATLTNVTFSTNSANSFNGGGGMYNKAGSSPTLINCILWGNTPDQIYSDNSTPAVTYSTVQGGFPGTGNIAGNPLFVDADGPDNTPGTPDDDLRLRDGSPAIDAGSNGHNSSSTDLDGNPRVADGNGDGNVVIDMGAYEVPTHYQLTVVKTGAGSGTVTSDPQGIDCGTTCNVALSENSVITLTATADAGSLFTGWYGSCSGSSPTCALTMTASQQVVATFGPVPPGSIVVDKVTEPSGDPRYFDFVLTGGPGSVDRTFSLTGAATPYDSGDLEAGTYVVAETVPEGWALLSATCDDGSDPGAIHLARGETVTCTFTNSKLGKIVVDKVTDPGGDPRHFDFALAGGPDSVDRTFSLTDAAAPYDSGDLKAGTYAVSETVPSGWALSSAICDDGSDVGAIDLAPGETVVCTFTNRESGRIVVDKVTDPSGDPRRFDFALTGGPDSVDRTFSLSDTAAPYDSGDLGAGTYSVREDTPGGWVLSSAICDDGSDPGAIDLAPGETVTCAFTNTKEKTRIFLPLVRRNAP